MALFKIRNVAVIGLRGVGRGHIAEGYACPPDKFQVQAICDLNPERLAEIGDEFDIPVRTTSFDEILAHAGGRGGRHLHPATMHIAARSLAALDAGKQVICEKPLVGSLADLDRVVKAEGTRRPAR